MKLTFEKIAYKNIMSVGASPIEIDLLNNKKIIITGKNGGGKSTMLEALCFALFGKPFRNIKKGQLVNSINKKAMKVDLWFNDGKHQYQITRGIKPTLFSILKDGEEMPEAASVKDFQTMFEDEIIKMNMQSFKQTIILGTAGYTPFMELTAGNRRTLIEDLINLSIYSKMDALNKSVVKEIKTQMDSLEIRLSGLRNEHEAHLAHIEKQKQMSSEFIDSLVSTYDTHRDAAKAIKEQVDQLTMQIGSVVIGTDYTTQLQKLSSAMGLIGGKISSIEKDAKFFHNNDNCPTCRQSISKAHSGEILARMGAEVGELNSKKTQTEALQVKYQDLQKDFMEASRLIRDLQNQVQHLRGSLQAEVSRANGVMEKIKIAREQSVVDTDRVDALATEIDEARKTKTDLFEEMYARKLVLGMLKDSGIKAVVMKRYVPVINKKINEYLKMLGADYTFTLDNEFNESIKSRGREDFSYTSFSQGEKARIDLALLFTWRDVAAIVSGTEISLLILDEVFDSATDGEGVEAIHSILESIKSNIIVISHREEHDKDRFNQHIRMVKKGRFSVMEGS